MKIGAVYPQTEMNGDPLALDAIGRALEAIGYDHVIMYDHVAGAVRADRDPPLWEYGPYDETHSFHDPFVAFGYLAGVTKRLEFATGVLVLPQRQTVLVARQAADVDLLSGGRMRLGVGLGWNYVEYDALGEDFSVRGPRMSEQIPYLRRLWSEPVVSFEGQYDRIDRAALNPRPRRMIPIWAGAVAEPGYRRAAQHADGLIIGGPVDRSLAALDRVRALVREEGRSVETFGADWLFQIGDGGGGQGDIDQVKRWQDSGASHVSILSQNLGLTTAEAHIDRLNEFFHGLKGIG
jgi:probable F420-dependent oxidoreductase